ncbi:MAG: zinc-ribbon domain-containing protein [Candidatus Heimdallarchaeota archaeon]
MTKPTSKEIDDIVASIDMDKILADIKAKQETPEYKAELAESTAKAHEKQGKKNRNIGIFALVAGILFLGTSFIALETTAFIFMLAAGILFLAFGGFMLYVSRQSKQAATEQKQTQKEFQAQIQTPSSQPQQQAQPSSTAKFCISCGQKITPGVKFCNKCGAEL